MRRRLTPLVFLLSGLLAAFLIACGPAVPPDEAGTTSGEAAASEPADAGGADTPTEASEAEAAAEAPAEAVAPAPGPMPVEGETITTASGLQVELVKAGDGPALEEGQLVEVHYVGSLDDGTVFDSSRDRGESFVFPLGITGIIPGWNEGIALLRIGDQARLILPPELAYGSQGAGGVIPPDATLTFDVEVLAVRPGPPENPRAVDEGDYTETDSGLRYFDFVVGEGAMPAEGQTVVVNYTGWLPDGTLFDSSLNRGQTFAFILGAGQVIPGWDEGLATMQVGGERQLVIPSSLGYGPQGSGPIPPDATLIFEVELVEIR